MDPKFTGREAPRIKQDKDRISTMKELVDFLKIKGPLYFSALSQITGAGNRFGWQKISKWEDGATRKIDAEPRSEGAVFTGRVICNFASFALYDGLKSKLENVDLDVVSIYTDFRAEDWDKPYEQRQEWDHVVVKATLKETGEIVYLDSTYRQIDHRAVGSILTIPEYRFKDFYRDRKSRQPVSVLKRKDEILEELKPWGLTKEHYQTLIDILK
jgi:hypothetical protein